MDDVVKELPGGRSIKHIDAIVKRIVSPPLLQPVVSPDEAVYLAEEDIALILCLLADRAIRTRR